MFHRALLSTRTSARSTPPSSLTSSPLTPIATPKKKPTQSKRKRGDNKSTAHEEEKKEREEEEEERGEEEDDEIREEKEEDEKAKSNTDTVADDIIHDEEDRKRVTKKTKRVVARKQGEEETTTIKAAPSKSSTASSNSVNNDNINTASATATSTSSPALQCDSDSLSLIFSFLTTREFVLRITLVSHRWSNVATQLPSTWPKYSLTSAIHPFHSMNNILYSIESPLAHQHRHVKVRDLNSLLTDGKTKGIMKNASSLHIIPSSSPSSSYIDFRPLTHANFPHLTSLQCENISLTGFVSYAKTLIQQLYILDLRCQFHHNFLHSFIQLRVLNVHSDSSLDESSLVHLHQLEYFRLESSHHLQFTLTRILRYLSVRYSLRSVVFATFLRNFGVQDAVRMREKKQALDVLLITPWKMIELSPEYIDPIPSNEIDLPIPIFHEFEYSPKDRAATTSEHFTQLCMMPSLTRLTCPLVNDMSLKSKSMSDPDASAAASDKFMQQLQHLSLFLIHDHQLDPLAHCSNLLTLRLTFGLICTDHLRCLTQLTQLEELTLEMRMNNVTLFHVPSAWTFLSSMLALRKFDLTITTERYFPISAIACNLGSLSHFVRFDLRLGSGSTFALGANFFSGIIISSTWTQFHLFLPYKYLGQLNTFERVPRLPIETLSSPALTRFRIHRHCKENEREPTIITTMHYIQVSPPKGKIVRPKAEWIKVEATES